MRKTAIIRVYIHAQMCFFATKCIFMPILFLGKTSTVVEKIYSLVSITRHDDIRGFISEIVKQLVSVMIS